MHSEQAELEGAGSNICITVIIASTLEARATTSTPEGDEAGTDASEEIISGELWAEMFLTGFQRIRKRKNDETPAANSLNVMANSIRN